MLFYYNDFLQTMKITKTVAELKELLAEQQDIALVPTMGALHQGHISLVEQARKIGKTVVVSVFVNPTQFNDPSDLEKYPRDLDADARLLQSAGADIMFAPSVDQIYPKDVQVVALEGRWEELATVMEGALRPGHFQGVVQVVGRLFDIVEPRYAFFGEKDFQQLAIIRSMVASEGRKIQIIGCPIVRAEDGLALSSRNALLSKDERSTAPAIYAEINALKARINNELDIEIEKLLNESIENLKNIKYLCPEYIEVVDPDTLQPTSDRTRFRICTAVKCGAVRLIDNI